MAENVNSGLQRKLKFHEELRIIYGKKKNVKNKSKLEMQELLKQNESFETKLKTSSKTTDDYRDYITFKKKFFSKLVAREGFSNPDKLHQLKHLQHSITAQIKALYLDGLDLFPREVSFWQAYIQFCRVTKLHSEGSAAYEKFLIHHGDKPKFWLDAVDWECEETQNIVKAKSLLLLSIKKHPKCESLYLKLYNILLSSTNSEESADYRLAIAIFQNTRNCKLPIDYWAKVLDVVQEYPYTKKFQKILLHYIIDDFPIREHAWHILAQRDLKGFDNQEIMRKYCEEGYTKEKLEEIDKGRANSIGGYRPSKRFARRLQLCVNVYESAVKVIKRRAMWACYINTMLEVNRDKSFEKDLKWKALERAFQGAIKKKKILETHFYTYIDILKELNTNQRKIYEVIKLGPSLFPKSATQWEKYMRYFIIKQKKKKVDDVFRHACRELGDVDEMAPLWRTIIQYYQTLPNKNQPVIELYWAACNHKSREFMSFRVRFLDYCIMTNPLEINDVYETLSALSPPYLKLHRRMASFLSISPTPDKSQLRKCLQTAIKLFGRRRSDVWMDYMKFEGDHGDRKKIGVIFKEATTTLNDKENKQLRKDFNMFNAIFKLGFKI